LVVWNPIAMTHQIYKAVASKSPKDMRKLRKIVKKQFKVMPFPKLKAPKIKAPKLALPKIGLPKLKLPEIKAPKIKAPKLQLPKIGLPKLKMPDILGGIQKFFGGIFGGIMNFIKKWWWVILLIVGAVILIPVLPSLFGALSSAFGIAISGIRGITGAIGSGLEAIKTISRGERK